MENASKALIIAGAILLSILLIGIGMAVFSMARGTINKANLSEQEKMTFNQKFTQYQGDKVRGSSVEALLSQIIATNSDDDDETPVLTYTHGTITDATADNTVRPSGTYVVTFTYTDGLVTGVTITP